MNFKKKSVLAKYFIFGLLVITQTKLYAVQNLKDPNQYNLALSLNYETPAKDIKLPIFAYLRLGANLGRRADADDIECGTIEWNSKLQKWFVNLDIGIWGAVNFSRTSRKSWEETQVWQKAIGEPNPAEEKYFTKSFENGTPFDKMPKSIQEIPDLAKIISEQINQIQAMYNTKKVEFKINYFFINEKILSTNKLWEKPDSELSMFIENKLYKPEVRAKMNGSRPFLPLKYSSNPQPSYVTPGTGDPFTWPELMAHEIFHLISREHYNDGYTFKNYPIQGVMNGGAQFRFMRDHKIKPQLIALELNTMYFNQLNFMEKKSSTQLTDPKKRRINFYSEENILDISNSSNDENGMKILQAELEEQLKIYNNMHSK